MKFMNNRPLTITLIIALVLVILLIFAPGSGRVSGAQNLAGGTVSGVQGFLDSIASGIGSFFSNIFNPSDLEKENISLKEQVALLLQQVQSMDELQQENERLQGLLDYKSSVPQYTYIVANITAKDAGYWFDTFVINVGYNGGVEKNDAVITPDGLVGRVYETYGSYSKVMAIIDSESAVSCIVERTRDNGIVKGGVQLSDESGLCRMEFLPLDADIIPGDKVVTSGLGEVFPKGLTVGEIKEVDTSGSDSTVVVKPAVDFEHLEEVMVIKAG